MEIWKTLRVSHIPTPPATTTDNCPTKRYTNNPLGTKDRSGHHLGAAKLGSTTYLHKAIRKYGSKAFTVETIHTVAQNANNLNEWEVFYIEALRKAGKLGAGTSASSNDCFVHTLNNVIYALFVEIGDGVRLTGSARYSEMVFRLLSLPPENANRQHEDAEPSDSVLGCPS